MLAYNSLMVQCISRNKDNIERQSDRQNNVDKVFGDVPPEAVHLIWKTLDVRTISSMP